MVIHIKRGAKYLKDHPTVPISAATLTVSTANLATNRSRHDKDREYQERQLEAMDKLTRSLNKTEKALDNNNNQARSVIVKRPVFSGFIPGKTSNK
jgi:hypothetical protein